MRYPHTQRRAFLPKRSARYTAPNDSLVTFTSVPLHAFNRRCTYTMLQQRMWSLSPFPGSGTCHAFSIVPLQVCPQPRRPSDRKNCGFDLGPFRLRGMKVARTDTHAASLGTV